MRDQSDEDFLRSHGWHDWYNPDYWVHKDLVTDPARMDYTYYGMSKAEAVKHEKAGRKKIINGAHTLMVLSACNERNLNKGE